MTPLRAVLSTLVVLVMCLVLGVLYVLVEARRVRHG